MASLASKGRNQTLNYAQSGVDRQAADRFVGRIAGLAKETLNKKVKAAVGGYASLYELDKKTWLAASTDGVGTKLKLAFLLGDHSTVGIDLVAMSVNDLLCVGACPLFFLDYFATGQLESGVAEAVLSGIVEGCKQARCALVGGETAQMPDFYQKGEYDLGGFAIGSLSPREALPRKDVRPGDALVGIASSGAHSNGYSLLRKLLKSEKDPKKRAWELLAPTRIYVKSLAPLLKERAFKGLAHITGSAFLNVPRISSQVSYEIELPATKNVSPVFGWIQSRSGLPLSELAQTFNLGIGMVGVVDQKNVKDVLRSLKSRGERAWLIGQVIRRKKGSVDPEVVIHDPSGSYGSERSVVIT